MSQTRSFILSRHIWSRYRNRDGEVRCYTCGERLKPGDRVTSAYSGKSRHRKLRHRACAERIGLILPEGAQP